MSKKILLIGNGAREHAIAEALQKSKGGVEIFAVGKTRNPGICGDGRRNAGLLNGGEYLLKDVCNIEAIRELAVRVRPDFAVVGPEAPIAAGIVDMLLDIGVHSASPLQTVGRLESSKSFTRNLVEKHKIPGNPKYKVFYNEKGLKEFFKELGEDSDALRCFDRSRSIGTGYVVKADGLKGGKGVKVSGDHLQGQAEGLAYAKECLVDCGRVVIEEKLIGQEFSLMSFCDGINTAEMPCVQDHKRAYEGDEGPNCYSEDTEILTTIGWKKFSDIDQNSEVMTFDYGTNKLAFEKPQKVYWMPYKGPMFYFKHREIDLLVTPNHRMLFEQRKRAKKRFVVEAKRFRGENNILLTGNWEGVDLKHYALPEFDFRFNRKIQSKKITFITWVRFMALFLSEGYVSKEKRGGCRVYVCQSPVSRHFKKMKKILESMPYPVTYSDNKFRINSTQLAKELCSFGSSHKKFVPNYIKGAGVKIILEFLKTFCMGDGDIHYGKMRFHSSSKKLIDDLQEMIFKLGYSSIITKDKRSKMTNPITKKVYNVTFPVYSLEMKKKRKVTIRRGLEQYGKIENYDGFVGCVTVSTGFVVVRRNERICISGNTGGMGTYSDANHGLPFLRAADIEEATAITQQVAAALLKETGCEFKGVMYGGFIAVKNGVRLIEYNARFGDPEAMNVLSLLKTDFVEVCEAIIHGELAGLKVEFENKATVCKYVVPEGYPGEAVKGEKIEIGELPKGVKAYYASVDAREDGLYLAGSRAVAMVGIADNLEAAERLAEAGACAVKGPVFHRKDIGTAELIGKRVEMMKGLKKLFSPAP